MIDPATLMVTCGAPDGEYGLMRDEFSVFDEHGISLADERLPPPQLIEPSKLSELSNHSTTNTGHRHPDMLQAEDLTLADGYAEVQVVIARTMSCGLCESGSGSNCSPAAERDDGQQNPRSTPFTCQAKSQPPVMIKMLNPRQREESRPEIA